MGFLGVYKAIYDYEPQSEEELALSEGDILYILEKGNEDCWWKAKKKALEVDEEEPVGLVPNNYIEEAESISYARALYDYTRQTDEELSFTENSELEVFDTSDADWILVGLDGEYGFAPANYIEIKDLKESTSYTLEADPQSQSTPTIEVNQTRNSTGFTQSEGVDLRNLSAPVPKTQYMSEASEDEKSPTTPSQTRHSLVRSSDHIQKHHRSVSQTQTEESNESLSPNSTSLKKDIDNKGQSYGPQGFHMYNINEMVYVMGRRRKMPTTLGVNNATGVILIAPEKSRDGLEQRWTAEKMKHYSIEGKHVFLEMVNPKKSVDFHAGAKDTAQEIVSALGEIAGAIKAEGLREVIMAGSGRSQKKGRILYDFTAQEENEVTVTAGDEVILICDTKNEEWWQIRRLKDGSEGVVPSSYVESIEETSALIKTGNMGRSIVERNRLEEEKLAKESVRAGKGLKNTEVGPGMRLPERDSSLLRQENINKHGLQKNKSERNEIAQLKPDPSKVRTWNDRSKSFSVEAQFLALKDGKINLHKMNGVKIAVPVSKMSIEDLEYVERQTGLSLDDDKPLSGIRKNRSQGITTSIEVTPSHGAFIEKKVYDWFQFFLDCEVSVNLCERYSQAFQRDSMDESVLPDIDATVLRTLGIREGDIIKIMRFLDKKFSRPVPKRSAGLGSEITAPNGDTQGGLFSGPGGTLKNNTRKTRPSPAVQSSNTINLDVFSREITNKSSPDPALTPTSPAKDQSKSGFEDDFWDVKQSTQQASSPFTSGLGSQPQPNQTTTNLSGSMKDLSLLAVPLEPIKLHPTSPPEIKQTSQQPPKPPQTVTPSFFAGIGSQQTGLKQLQSGTTNFQPRNKMDEGVIIPSHLQDLNRPFQSQNQGLIISAPNRPLSAPVVNQNSPYILSSLQPQATGIQTSSGYQQQIYPNGQNVLDPRVRQVSNGFNGLQSQVSMGGVFGQQVYNQFSNQSPSNLQQNFQQFPLSTGIPQQKFQSGVISPFSDTYSQQISPNSAQPSGSFPQKISQQTGINSFLSPSLQPTPATISSHTKFNPSISAHINSTPSQLNFMNPLVPQKTGPPPPVKFGVPDNQKKLTPQPTGRRANISQATPQNPFGF
ncbi:Actin cytoskeleton-regulatory complex protein sla1 [Golovinomyces cichoracearum]|uniref:Actin cytoskeleton-regulatory complex protein SLA1 n=1 Tax=Golovinomyces cichoracearum TaxID=62708 RepID=A0A420HHJ8_9PEZI|nr:Actin cytoskeleton-regulatory complex protein sla1 [Golovinomyces cichoracearum]